MGSLRKPSTADVTGKDPPSCSLKRQQVSALVDMPTRLGTIKVIFISYLSNLDSWITDEKCFIFSLDLKEKYLHKAGNQCSMYGRSDLGPYFGGAPDFYLSNNCHSNTESYCNPNNTYDCKQRTYNDIAGIQYFQVKSYEVFLIR